MGVRGEGPAEGVGRRQGRGRVGVRRARARVSSARRALRRRRARGEGCELAARRAAAAWRPQQAWCAAEGRVRVGGQGQGFG